MRYRLPLPSFRCYVKYASNDNTAYNTYMNGYKGSLAINNVWKILQRIFSKTREIYFYGST